MLFAAMNITNITSGYKNEYIKRLMFKENHLLFNENFDLCKKIKFTLEIQG